MNEIRRSNERGVADHGWLKVVRGFPFIPSDAKGTAC